MGSKSDWETMSHADAILTEFGIPHECQVVSAHRTPAWMSRVRLDRRRARPAGDHRRRRRRRASARHGGGADRLPVIGVPVQSAALNGLDSLLSIVQMPKGVPVATVAIGPAGAANAGLLAIAILATSRPELRR